MPPPTPPPSPESAPGDCFFRWKLGTEARSCQQRFKKIALESSPPTPPPIPPPIPPPRPLEAAPEDCLFRWTFEMEPDGCQQGRSTSRCLESLTDGTADTTSDSTVNATSDGSRAEADGLPAPPDLGDGSCGCQQVRLATTYLETLTSNATSHTASDSASKLLSGLLASPDLSHSTW